MKKFSICPQCIAKAKVPELNKVEVGEIARCSECGKYGFMRQLNSVQVGSLKAGQKKEADRKAKRVAEFQARKVELAAEKKTKTKAVRKKVNLKSITI